MRAKRLALAGAALAAIAGGGAAVAATHDGDGRRAEQEVLDRAADRLGVEPGELRDALAAAQDAELDEAVREGRLTRERADAIERHRRESGRVLGFPRGGPGHGGHGLGLGHRGPRGAVFEAMAKELGISVAKLHKELHGGDTLAEVARAHGRSIADLRRVAQAAMEREIDAAVKDGRLTERQADRLRERIPERLRRLGERPRRLRGGPGHGPDMPPPGP